MNDNLHPAVPEKALPLLRKVFAAHAGIREVRLFGSRAKGTHRPGSDIDLCVFADAWKSRNLMRLEEEIDALNLPEKTDLLLWHEIDHEALREHIERVGWRLYPA